jgi:hypothetical protein
MKMITTTNSADEFRIVINREELRILASCINEALEMTRGEFSTRVGATVDEALRVMEELHRLLDATRS